MIFVTVGTHEQPFNRLIEYIDILKSSKKIKDDIIIQTGFSTYQPAYCIWDSFFPYQYIEQKIKEARIVITHGGPSSFMLPLQFKKIPVVVPRQKTFNEHVNNHQLEFCRTIAERKKNIILIEDIINLESTILNYESIVQLMSTETKDNNTLFNQSFDKMVKELFLSY